MHPGPVHTKADVLLDYTHESWCAFSFTQKQIPSEGRETKSQMRVLMTIMVRILRDSMSLGLKRQRPRRSVSVPSARRFFGGLPEPRRRLSAERAEGAVVKEPRVNAADVK